MPGFWINGQVVHPTQVIYQNLHYALSGGRGDGEVGQLPLFAWGEKCRERINPHKPPRSICPKLDWVGGPSPSPLPNLNLLPNIVQTTKNILEISQCRELHPGIYAIQFEQVQI